MRSWKFLQLPHTSEMNIDHLKLINQRVKNSQSCLIDTGMKLQLFKKSLKWYYYTNNNTTMIKRF